MSDTNSLALYGAVTGTIGALLGILAFTRDAPRLIVEFSWDVVRTGVRADGYTEQIGPVALFRIANVGRRPIYVSIVHFEPQTIGGLSTVVTNGVRGKTLTEGSEPIEIMTEQSTYAHLGGDWWRLRAAVVDGGGRIYRSRWPTKKPSFATEDAPPLALVVNHLLNWLARHLRL